jgi:uncharacterized delta-60 repeat protein
MFFRRCKERTGRVSRQLVQCATLCWFALAALSAHPIPGQPGTLDASFANASAVGSGRLKEPIGQGSGVARAIVVQPDGKILLAGSCAGSVNDDFCVLRLNSNGTPDTTFGSGGKVVESVGTSFDYAHAMALQPDGKILLVGECYNDKSYDFCAIRLSPTGTLDASFDGDGRRVLPIATNNDIAYAVAVQTDGKIVLGGECNNGDPDFCVVRLNTNGSTDTTFGGGVVTLTIPNRSEVVRALAIQPDGKIVLAGDCSNGSNNDFCIVRLNTNGTPDNAFGMSSASTSDIGGGNDRATALAIQPDGKIVAAGFCRGATNIDFCALRVNSDGSPDPTFGSDGNVIVAVGSNDDFGNAIALQADGKIVLTGECFNADEDVCTLRLNSDGGVYASFSADGQVVESFGSASSDSGRAVAIQPDGKIVVAGRCSGDFCAAR